MIFFYTLFTLHQWALHGVAPCVTGPIDISSHILHTIHPYHHPILNYPMLFFVYVGFLISMFLFSFLRFCFWLGILPLLGVYFFFDLDFLGFHFLGLWHPIHAIHAMPCHTIPYHTHVHMRPRMVAVQAVQAKYTRRYKIDRRKNSLEPPQKL